MKLAQVAEIMRICEFDLFRQAYAVSQNDAPNDEFVGQAYMDYATDGVVPAWVFAYAHNITENSSDYARLRAVA